MTAELQAVLPVTVYPFQGTTMRRQVNGWFCVNKQSTTRTPRLRQGPGG
ncbi:MAG: hypothetical protein VB072_03560 [Lentimicrobium sp.]|nr:hypothetical protein [Lentimicrobium sp.]MEA5109479.1 hypothetical protein [Lentimicrobium sp.]